MTLRIGNRRGLILASSAAGNGLKTDLAAFWPMNEASGDALDLVGSHTLTAYNAPGADTGLVYATARTFDGGVSSQYFKRAHDAALVFGNTDWTVAAWVYNTAWPTNPPLDYHYIMHCGEAWAGGFAMFINNATNIVESAYAVGAVDTTGTHGDALTNLNAWKLVFVGWDAVNSLGFTGLGVAAYDTTAEVGTHAAAAASALIWVGSVKATSYWFEGRIGPIMVWNRVLSTDDRTALYNGGLGLAYTSFTS